MLEHKLQTLKRTEEHKRIDMNAKIVEQKTAIQRKKEIISKIGNKRDIVLNIDNIEIIK